MQSIQTTGCLFTEEDRKIVISNICNVFDCEESEIEELVPVQTGLTNVVLSFRLNGGKYVYRHPGLGSEVLVERGRETIMQKIVEDEDFAKEMVKKGFAVSKNFNWENTIKETVAAIATLF